MKTKTAKLWRDDDELFALARRELFTAVVGDIMDQLGFQRQFLPPKIQPLRDDMVVIGRAMPVLEADMVADGEPSGKNPVMAQPFGLMLHALDDLKRNEVYLCAGASPEYALWGELMSLRAQKLGAVGAVMDGWSRDTRGILEMGFPCFSHGRYAQDQAPRGKVIDFRCSLQIGNVRAEPGDIIFGDLDGVCVVPRKAEREVFAKALEKARGEKLVRQALEKGMSARDAFRKFKIM
ncbi:MAG: RraA family protein [Verrucomicrobiaceae bacterium]|nr:RraA family protein [Verrucomicrobiaceae bacterium]